MNQRIYRYVVSVSHYSKLSVLGEMDFGRKEWARSRETVDNVMDLLLKQLRAEATKYEGLRIDSYIRQGSSRDGLKVVAPDEYDTILEFHIEGLEYNLRQKSIHKQGKLVPGFCFMTVENKTIETIKIKFPALFKEGVFIEQDSVIHISSRALHQRVFESMFDRACVRIIEQVSALRQTGQSSNFNIKRKMNPPAINITISLEDDDAHQLFMRAGRPKNVANLTKEIDLDVVPGILLRNDNATSYNEVLLNCPIHAVCKWAEDNRQKALDFVNSSLVWDVKTTGYEKHILDVARRDRRNLYILTALRIVKTYFVRTKSIARQAGHPPPQIVTVLKSYHLKQIAIYLIFYLCHKYPNYKLYGAQKAVFYFTDLLRISLNAESLPHFFYSKNKLHVMLPGFQEAGEASLKYNLFRGISKESLKQALQSFDNHLIPNLGFCFGGETDSEREQVKTEYTCTCTLVANEIF